MKQVICDVCTKPVKLTTKCLCGKFLCAKCTLTRYDHSPDYDKEHAKRFWDLHPEENEWLDSIKPLIEQERQNYEYKIGWTT